ncbi:DUF1622 domain-containing protein [Nostoc sp. C057]|uniref:DUF1622 domain-containing protein n=1 Tax=Nostoc sp. C057 TaxID=2576903 RepID=UPI0015C2D4A9|nr:DUF1622 domain-containing protein [Nostoc sp. C057]QLE46857.1 DUF1622 domain-containing protein [Nostoc sp. C057]
MIPVEESILLSVVRLGCVGDFVIMFWAADILRSTIAQTWDEIGKLAAIIALRTILNFFLAKEIEQAKNKKNDIKDESF